jgi:hypothetical protein
LLLAKNRVCWSLHRQSFSEYVPTAMAHFSQLHH